MSLLNQMTCAFFKAEWIIPDCRPPNAWPDKGNIEFKGFDLRYREGLPLVLQNINCVITPGEKVIYGKSVLELQYNLRVMLHVRNV